MAGLVDACSSSDDHPHLDGRRCLAPVRRRLQRQSFFPPALHLLDHSRNASSHPAALGSAGALAWRPAGSRRCRDGFAAGLFHWSARELFHLPLSAGDYRREYLVHPEDCVFSHRGLLHSPRPHGGAHLYRADSSYLREPADAREPAHLAGHESSRFSSGRVSDESSRTFAPQQGPGTRRKT